jgi:hypothetical protein
MSGAGHTTTVQRGHRHPVAMAMDHPDVRPDKSVAPPKPSGHPLGRRLARVLKAVGIGAVAGFVGTLTMSLLMLPANWIGLLGTQPPRRITDRLVESTGRPWRASERDRRIGTTIVHLGIGVGAGAGLGAVRELRILAPLNPITGAALGSAFWAINYIGIAPALGLLPIPTRDRPGRPVVMLAANALFGAVTATLIEGALARETDQQSARA